MFSDRYQSLTHVRNGSTFQIPWVGPACWREKIETDPDVVWSHLVSVETGKVVASYVRPRKRAPRQTEGKVR